jgi:hypothetical protein
MKIVPVVVPVFMVTRGNFLQRLAKSRHGNLNVYWDFCLDVYQR